MRERRALLPLVGLSCRLLGGRQASHFSLPYLLPHRRACIHCFPHPELLFPRRVFTCCRTATLAVDTAHSNTKPSPSCVMQVWGVSHTAVPREAAGVQGRHTSGLAGALLCMSESP